MNLLLAVLIATAPSPTPTPHHIRCIGDAFDADLGPIACWRITPSPSPAPTARPWFERFCADRHAGTFMAAVEYKHDEFFIACSKADFQRTVTGWKRYTHYE